MCLSIENGGIRCHSHATEQLANARQKLSKNPDAPDLQASVADAQHQLELTATERKKLLTICEDPSTPPEQAVEARRKYDILTGEHNERAGVSPFTARYGSYEEQVNAFKAEIVNTYASINTRERLTELLNTMAKFHNYSPVNQLLIHAQNPSVNRVAGFKKWQAEFERTVKKGEKAIRIFAPSQRKVEQTDKDGNVLNGPDGKPLTRNKTVGFRVVAVFGDTQTEGKALPQPHALTETPPEGFADDLTAAIEAEGYKVRYEDTGFAGGWTSSNREVVINSHASPASRAKTLAHELAHIKAGHIERDDYHSGPGGCRGEMEMEAESLAYLLCRSNGMSTEITDSATAYIKGWEAQSNGKTAEDSIKAVSVVFKEMMSNGRWRNAH